MIATACGGAGTATSGASPSNSAAVTARAGESTSAALRFLTRYVASDGRVIRRDQGGDTVSEGQAYGLLIAEVARKPGLVRAIWSWTVAHLLRPDGLFAWHASPSGKVEDSQSATDADILIAYALLRYSGTDQAALHRAGRRVAGAVLSNESVVLPAGPPVPVAGPWGRSTSPPTVNPSYLMPGVLDALARFTGDRRWQAAAGAAVSLVRGLTADGSRLPPDWSALSGGRLVAIAQPGGPGGVRYGLDAARVPVWFATACDPVARSLAASWWRNVLHADDRSASLALKLNGATINAASSPLTLISGAAAATAAGDVSAARGLRTRAVELALHKPTYYGDAWVVLGEALLDGSISPCQETGGG